MNREDQIKEKIRAGLTRQQAEEVVNREEAERIPKLKAAVKEAATRLDGLHQHAKDTAEEIVRAAKAYDDAVKALEAATTIEEPEPEPEAATEPPAEKTKPRRR